MKIEPQLMAFLGGPSNGKVSLVSSDTVMVPFFDMPPMHLTKSGDTTDGYLHRHYYNTEKISYQNPHDGSVVSAFVMVHNSVPPESLVSFFYACLDEFPEIRTVEQYKFFL